MFDINKYNITETELNQYRDNLVIDIGEWSCEKWAGESFNGTSPDLIREHHGEGFYVYRKDGAYQFIGKESNLSEMTLNMINVEKGRLCEEYFMDRLFPVDADGSPIKPIALSDTERAILETAINTEYLVCLAEINNM